MAIPEQMTKLQESFDRKVKTFNIVTPNVFENVKGLPRIKMYEVPMVTIFEMLDERFGDNWIWSTTMWNEETTVFFKDQSDALVFKLLFNYKPLDTTC